MMAKPELQKIEVTLQPIEGSDYNGSIGSNGCTRTPIACSEIKVIVV